MKYRKIIGVIAMVMLLAGLAVMPVLAQPTVCTFEGDVALDGATCVGSTVEARLGTTVVLTATVAAMDIDEVSHPSYYIMVIAQDLDTGVPAEGAALNFYVDGNLATTTGDTATWNAGGEKFVNLAATSGAVTYYTLTMAVSPALSGTTSPAAGPHSYAAGTSVTLTATEGSGYDFSHWSGTNNNAINPTTVTMNTAKTVTANFVVEGTLPRPQTFAWWLYATFIEPFM